MNAHAASASRKRHLFFGVLLGTLSIAILAPAYPRALSMGTLLAPVAGAQARPPATRRRVDRRPRFPRTIAGFRLGASLRVVVRLCEGGGGIWRDDIHADGFLNFTCSIAPEPLPAELDVVVLSFRRGRLDGLSLLFGSRNSMAFDAALRERYGTPLSHPSMPGTYWWSLAGGMILAAPNAGGIRYDYATTETLDRVAPARQTY